MTGKAKKAVKALSSTLGTGGRQAEAMSTAGLAAAGTGVAGMALVSSPSAQEVKSALGYGPETSLIRTGAAGMAREAAAPPGKDYGGGSLSTETTIAIGSSAAVGGLGGAYAAGGVGQSNPAPTFPLEKTPETTAGAAKQAGKGAFNKASRFFSSSRTIGAIGATAGVAAGAALAGRAVDRLARKVVRTGTPASRETRSPTQPQRQSKRTPTTSAGVSDMARRTGAPSGSMVLDLHKTGGSGGVMT